MKKLQSCLIALVCSAFLCSHSASGQTGELWEQTGIIIPCQTEGPDLATTFQYINKNVGGTHGIWYGQSIELSKDHETITNNFRRSVNQSWAAMTARFPVALMDCRTLVVQSDATILYGCQSGSDTCAQGNGYSPDPNVIVKSGRPSSCRLFQKDEDAEGALRLAKAMSRLIYLLQQEHAAKSQNDPFAH